MSQYTRAIGIAVVFAVAASTVASQAPAFEVASIKINRSGFPGGASGFRPGGQFRATNETLRQLIRVAYGLETFRILDGPDWLDTARFDIQARASGDVPQDAMLLMLQQLLAERFRLSARNETKDSPVYELLLSRPDGRSGARLRPASSDACTDRGAQPASAPVGQLPSCGILLAGPDRISGRRVNLDLLARELSARVNRVVVNRTGLAGMFDVDLEWTADDAERAAIAALTPAGVPPTIDPNRPGVFTALNEQLGLKLQDGRGPVAVLIVDAAQPPTED